MGFVKWGFVINVTITLLYDEEVRHATAKRHAIF